MSGALARAVAVARLELAVQRREPLTALYPLVLGLLAFAYASGGPVELVPARGPVPRGAPWALALACTGLVAFGQVITTMVAATVILRDRAVRMDALLATGALRRVEYLGGKLAAALVVLLAVYAAIPVGLWLGLAADGGVVRALDATGAVLRPFALLVVPVMLGVGLLQFALGALAGRLWAIVGQGLVLLWLWGAALGAAEGGASGAATWLDPFASAPVVAATRAWPDTVRAVAPLPVDASLVANRALWLAIGALAAALAFARATIAAPVAVPRASPAAGDAAPPARVDAWRAVAAAPLDGWATVRAQAGYVARWMMRDAGWRVLAALGALNVAVNAWRAVPRDASPALAAAHALAAATMHARLFLILLATIYAGELVWREREQRTAPLLDALPARTGALVTGGLAGTVAAQAVLVALLAAVAWLAALVRTGAVPEVARYAAASVAWLLVPFVAWMACSWVVHVVVANKVAAHLLCIAAWVVAVTVDGRMRTHGWWRALGWPAVEPAAFAAGAPWDGALAASAAWLALSGVAVAAASRRVARGEPG